MLTSDFLKSLSEEELGILFMVAYNIFNYEVAYNSLKVLKKEPLINILEQLKSFIKEEHTEILSNFQKKLIDYN